MTDDELRAFWERCDEAASMFPLYVLDDARNVQRCSMKDWVEMKQHYEERCRVAATTIGDTWVSTMFLGIDMNHARVINESLPTMCFETLIKWPEGFDVFDRYSTWAEAEAGHAKAVAMVREGQE